MWFPSNDEFLGIGWLFQIKFMNNSIEQLYWIKLITKCLNWTYLESNIVSNDLKTLLEVQVTDYN